MKRTGLWTQIIAIIALGIVAFFGWQNRDQLVQFVPSIFATPDTPAAEGQQDSRTPVIVAQTTTRADDLSFSAIGTGFAQRSVTLRAPASGEIVALEIVAGRKFAADDVLLRLDDSDERLSVSLAEAQFERAELERARYRSLQARGAAAEARLEDAETAYKVARISLDQARAALDDRTLRAPFDGVAGLPNVEAGDRIVGDEVVSSFDDRSRILVEFDLPEAMLSRIDTGMPVQANTPAVGAQEFQGRITAVDSRVNAATRTARVRAAIENADDVLRPGTSFSLRLDLPGDTYPAVPELALQFSRGELRVWRVTGGTVEDVAVRLIRRRGGLVIVDGPLREGDTVVVEGMQRLQSGAGVRVLNPDEGAST